jgi:YbgC/YbaW family acyl-CoA thioester hydrolase
MQSRLTKCSVPLDLVFSQTNIVERGHPHYEDLAVWQDVPITNLEPYFTALGALRDGVGTLDTYLDFEREGSFLPVVNATANYKAPARYDDGLLIRTTVPESRAASVRFEYELVNEADQKLLCVGGTKHACVNREGRPVPIPEGIVRVLKERNDSPKEEK